MENVVNNYISVFKNGLQFSGRAGRREYWMFFAANLLLSIVLSVVDSITGVPLLAPLFVLAALVPSIAVGIRRLHDTGRSGWWLLAVLVPVLGGLIVLALMALPGAVNANRFGAVPSQTQPTFATA